MDDSPSEPIDPPILMEARELEIAYSYPRNPVTVVKDFTLAIREGEVLGLVGESGCGKSTVALALMGLTRLGATILRGQVMFRGQDLLIKSERELAAFRGRTIGLIVQNPRMALNPLISVGDQLANIYRSHRRASKPDALLHAVAALEAVGINDAGQRVAAYPHELSGGMAQRVLIAIATINEPDLLIADEPTTGLDVTIQAQILDLIRARATDVGASAVLVTHDLGIVAQYCDRVAVMAAGRIVEEGRTRTVFSRPQHLYTRRLLDALPERKLSLDKQGPARQAPQDTGQ